MTQPPNISGTWKQYNIYYLDQNTPNEEVSLKDIQHLDSQDIKIKQKESFITYESLKPNILRPVLGTRLGIWKPTYLDGEIINWANLNAREQPCCSWEAVVGDYDDSGLQFFSIVDVDKCGNPVKLFSTRVESGFQPDNDLQHPYVSHSLLKKIK
ncbi:Hypothetical protein HVR_LOCUS385 [uncultured virus]|nr:Hypothetical protein HVR_LOCUS385 [uncultured virus]